MKIPPFAKHFLQALFLAGFIALVLPVNVYAYSLNYIPASEPTDQDHQPGQCTDSFRVSDSNTNGTFMLSEIVKAVKFVLGSVSLVFYDDFVAGLYPYMSILLVIYIAVYGILIMFQLAPMTGAEVLTRVIKVTIVLMFFMGWSAYFNTYIASAVIGQMDFLIGYFLSVSQQTQPDATLLTSDPKQSDYFMGALGGPLQFILSSKFFIMFTSLMTTGFHGPFLITLVLGWAFVTLLRTIIAGLYTYLKAVVILFFLLALAPFFALFILFEEMRRKVFQGWINQIVGIMIQPILFFAFIGFFFSMIDAVLMNLMANFEACEVKTKLINGSGLDVIMNVPNMLNPVTKLQEPRSGDRVNFPPIDIMGLFMVWILIELGWRFSKYVEQIGKDISSGAVSLVVQGRSVSNVAKSFFK